MKLRLETCMACHEVALVDVLTLVEALLLCEFGQFQIESVPRDAWELRWCRSCNQLVCVNWITLEPPQAGRQYLDKLRKERTV